MHLVEQLIVAPTSSDDQIIAAYEQALSAFELVQDKTIVHHQMMVATQHLTALQKKMQAASAPKFPTYPYYV